MLFRLVDFAKTMRVHASWIVKFRDNRQHFLQLVCECRDWRWRSDEASRVNTNVFGNGQKVEDYLLGR